MSISYRHFHTELCAIDHTEYVVPSTTERRSPYSYRQLLKGIALAFVLTLLSSSSVFASDTAQSSVNGQEAEQTTTVAPEAPATIWGRIADEDGRPLEGIKVELFANDSSYVERKASSDEQGIYRFDFLGAGTYRLSFSDPAERFLSEYYQDATSLSETDTLFVASSELQADDTTLTLGGSIQGTVRTTDGQLLSQVRLGVSQYVTSENENGQNENSEAEQILTQVHNRSLSIITPTNSISYTIGGLDTGLYRICATGTISDTQAPAASCYDQPGTNVEEAQDISVMIGVTTTNIDIDLTPELFSIISGTVTSIQGGPLANIRVSAYISNTTSGWQQSRYRSVLTDEDGTYQLRLLSGIYTLHFSHSISSFLPISDYVPEFLGNVSDAEDATHFKLSDGEQLTDLDFVARNTAKINGTVTSDTGEGLPDITVTLLMSTTNYGWNPTYYFTKTNASGSYQLERVPPGIYTVNFENSGDQYIDEFLGNSPQEQTASIVHVEANNMYTDINFVPREGATVTGTVTLSDQLFTRAFQVQAHLWNGDRWEQSVSSYVNDNSGTFSLSALPPGRYRFVVEAAFNDIRLYSCYGSESFNTATEVELEIGNEIQNININMETDLFDGELGGAITYAGEPVAGILVAIDRKPEGEHLPTIEVFTGSDGRFLVEGVTPGSYCIRFSDPNEVYATDNYGRYTISGSCDRISLEAGESRTNIDHSLALGGSISGRVTDYEDKPTKNIEVRLYAYDTRTKRWEYTHLKTMVDADGEYSLSGLTSRYYRIAFIYPSGDEYNSTTVEYYTEYVARTTSIEAAGNIQVSSGKTTSSINYLLGASAHMEPKLFFPFAPQNR